MTWLDRVHELDELDVARALGVPPGRSGRGGLMAAILLAFLAIPGAAWARPTHGAIQPLDAGAELAGGDYDPVPVGRSWTYREPQSGARYRRLVVRGVTMLNRGDRPADVLRTREVYALDAAEPKLTERMVLDPEAAEGVAVLAAEVLALVLAGGAWRPARELESVGAYPATTTTLQPAPKPAGPKAP